MTVRPLSPDRAAADAGPLSPSGDDNAFARTVDAVDSIFSAAQRAEDAYARGAGTLRDAVYERTRADVTLSIAVAAASRAAQAVQSVLNMQI
jgi:flagellar hook-basal body complex protein FliE